MQLRLIAEADQSLKQAFELIQGMEAAARDVQEIQQNNKFALQTAAATNAVTETTPKQLPCSRQATATQHLDTRQPSVTSAINWVT